MPDCGRLEFSELTMIQKNADVLAGFYTSPESLNECGAVDVLYGFKV